MWNGWVKLFSSGLSPHGGCEMLCVNDFACHVFALTK